MISERDEVLEEWGLSSFQQVVELGSAADDLGSISEDSFDDTFC
jgi:hypothetical protein